MVHYVLIDWFCETHCYLLKLLFLWCLVRDKETFLLVPKMVKFNVRTILSTSMSTPYWSLSQCCVFMWPGPGIKSAEWPFDSPAGLLAARAVRRRRRRWGFSWGCGKWASGGTSGVESVFLVLFPQLFPHWVSSFQRWRSRLSRTQACCDSSTSYLDDSHERAVSVLFCTSFFQSYYETL